MGRKLPTFAAVRAFEAAARRGSFGDAAEELHVSASAISHQVRALETFIGAKLFIRDKAGLHVTPMGESYLCAATSALDRLEAATAHIMRDAEEGQLTVHMLPSFAQLWLIPRLSDFVSSNPSIRVNVVTKPDEPVFPGSSVDLAIRYFPTRPLDEADLLFSETITPVCSPEYLERFGRIGEPSDLLAHSLIGCDCVPDEWSCWFAANGIEAGDLVPGLLFDTRAQALEAARAGLGVAMSRRPYGDLLLRRGDLVAPVAEPMETGAGYFITMPERSAFLMRVKRFRDWLHSTSAESRRVI